MNKDIAKKVLRDPNALQALITQIDEKPGTITEAGPSQTWAFEECDNVMVLDVHKGSNGAAYVVTYAVGGSGMKHQGMYLLASNFAFRSCRRLAEHPVRFVTISDDSIEVTGFPPAVAGDEFMGTHMSTATHSRFDAATSPDIREFLALLRGEDSTSKTELGQAAKGALDGKA